MSGECAEVLLHNNIHNMCFFFLHLFETLSLTKHLLALLDLACTLCSYCRKDMFYGYRIQLLTQVFFIIWMAKWFHSLNWNLTEPDTGVLLTLRGLGAYIFLDQGICRLSVKAESVFKRFHIGALLKEGFLQPVSSSMEILLQKKRKEQLSFIIFQCKQKRWTSWQVHTRQQVRVGSENSLGLYGQYAFNKEQTHKENRQDSSNCHFSH